MHHLRVLGALLTGFSVAACTTLSEDSPECNCSQQESGSASNQRLILNQGYSMLYSSASGLSKIDLTFLVKLESDDVQTVVEDVSAYAGELASKLERVENEFPAVKIKLDPLPEMEKRKRAAARDDRLLDFAPVVGRTGANFERTLLLTLSGGLNQQVFLARVVKEEEPNAPLKEILSNVEQGYSTLYERVVKLLNEQYFKHNTYEPPEEDG